MGVLAYEEISRIRGFKFNVVDALGLENLKNFSTKAVSYGLYILMMYS